MCCPCLACSLSYVLLVCCLCVVYVLSMCCVAYMCLRIAFVLSMCCLCVAYVSPVCWQVSHLLPAGAASASSSMSSHMSSVHSAVKMLQKRSSFFHSRSLTLSHSFCQSHPLAVCLCYCLCHCLCHCLCYFLCHCLYHCLCHCLFLPQFCRCRFLPPFLSISPSPLPPSLSSSAFTSVTPLMPTVDILLHTRACTHRVVCILSLLEAMERGEVKKDHRLLRQVASLCQRLPATETGDFKEDFVQHYNDTLLVISFCF